MSYRNFAQSKWNKQYIQFILDNPDKPWDYLCLSKNPNITWEIVKDNPDIAWDYRRLSNNTMSKSKEAFIKKELIYDFSYKCAKDKVLKYLLHPQRYLGRKCIMELSNII